MTVQRWWSGALLVSSLSAPPSAHVFDVDGFSWVLDEPVDDMPGRAVSVTEGVVFLGDVGVHSLGDGSRIRILQAADDEIVSWRERRFHAFLAVNEILMLKITGQSLLKTIHNPLLKIPN